MRQYEHLLSSLLTIAICIVAFFSFGFLGPGFCPVSFGQEQQPKDSTDAETDAQSNSQSNVAAGHSYHGEAYNEGPRQSAYLMEGLGRAKFLVSTENELAQQFFNQAIDQLHGFWYFEAERSFRQVAVLDPDCAMAYWGLAMANVNNVDRAKKFVLQAQGKAASENRETSDREQLYIEALAAYYNEKVKDEKKRAEHLIDKLEEIVLEYPDDIEAKAFLAVRVWENRRHKLPITSHVAVNALLDQVFEVDPKHPAHHYRIHLWDSKNAKIALHSAANCGPALPNVAHMWHMPGHIYSKLNRYEDAVWQQEASARVDHRNMMHDQIMPDQIHNFAHNNEWCIRNLNYVGRVRDAIELATNMISMPRHPKYNHLKNRGSAWYGRQRLLDTLSQYELWQEMIDVCETSTLDSTDNKLEQFKRLRYLGRAHFRIENIDEGAKILKQFRDELAASEEERTNSTSESTEKVKTKTDELRRSADKFAALLPARISKQLMEKVDSQIRRDHRKLLKKATTDATREIDNKINVVKRAINELEGYQLIGEQKYADAIEKFKKAGEVDAIFRATIRHQFGETEQAIKEARKHVESRPNQVQPLANLCWLLWHADQKDEAATEFEKLRKLSGSIDGQSPVFERLQVIAEHCKIQGDWRVASTIVDDIGERPELDSLGPFRWQPVQANDWELVDSNEQTVSSKQFQGKPVIVIFYLGHGCLHCAEQLQKFAPMWDEFKNAGIELVAISTDDRDGLKKSIEAAGDSPLSIQLLADPKFQVFQQFRAFDEFENQPLHGTFLIDGDGKIRWQDISYEPFMDPEFLLKESQRLLALPNIEKF